MMPGMEGIEICRRIRSTPAFELMYVILLTSRDAKEDLAMGLIAGANDYITKPFHALEIEARVRVGERMVKLQKSLAARISELEEALTHTCADCRDCCRSAAIARRSETKRTTGSRSIRTSYRILKWSSLTACARIAPRSS